MTQGRLKTSKARSAKAGGRKARNLRKPARKAVAKASRKKSTAKSSVQETTKRGAKARRKKAPVKQVAKASRKKSAANRAPKVSTVVEVTASAKPSTQSSRSKRVAAVVEQPKKLKPPSPRRPVQLGLGFDDTQDVLAVLQQQNNRLMSKIGKRRASLQLLRQLSEELMQEASQRVLPYREELKALTRELLDLESSVLGAEKLVGRNRDQVRLVFHELLKGLPQDELEAEAEAAADSPTAASVDAETQPSPFTQDSSSKGAEPAGVDGQSLDHSSADAAGVVSRAATNGEPASPPTTKAQSEVAQPEARSADKPAGDQSGALRSLFKRLVIQWHPDRVRDDAQKAERTKLMKEFTQAFEAGDLAKLVALEQTLALKNAPTQPTPETPEKRAEQLRRANAELLKQLGELQDSLEAVREDCPFTLDYRKKDPASSARDELDEFVLVNHLAVQRATATRDFVLNFARGKMKLAEFLQGPRRSS